MDWSGTHIGFVLFGFLSSGCEQRQRLDIGSSKLVDHRTSSYLGELSGVVYALKKTRALRGASPTVVFNDNRALVEQLQRGASVTHDVRIARQISYLLANEANASYRFVPGGIDRGADLLFREKQSPMNTAQLVQPTPRERPEMDIIAQGHQGHWGFEETKKNVELAYGTWPGLAEDVKTFVERCDRCQFHGSRQHRDPPRLEISTEFGDRMCMDTRVRFEMDNISSSWSTQQHGVAKLAYSHDHVRIRSYQSLNVGCNSSVDDQKPLP